MFDAELCDRAAKLIALCRARGLTIASAESCTGGLVAGPHHLDRRLLGRVRARLRHLLQCGQGRKSRRRRRAHRSFRRGQRRGRAGDGGRASATLARRCRRLGHGHRRPRRRIGGKTCRPRPFRLRASRRDRRRWSKSASAILAARRCASPPSQSRSTFCFRPPARHRRRRRAARRLRRICGTPYRTCRP